MRHHFLTNEVSQCRLLLAYIVDDFLVHPRLDSSLHQCLCEENKTLNKKPSLPIRKTCIARQPLGHTIYMASPLLSLRLHCFSSLLQTAASVVDGAQNKRMGLGEDWHGCDSSVAHRKLPHFNE